MVEELSPQQALDRFEPQWAANLGAVNLVGEFEVPTEQATLILRAVALMARKPKRRAALSNYPACVAVGLATFASAHYSGGALWDSLFTHVHVRDTPEERTTLGTAFLRALVTLDLPTVGEGMHYLAPITFHAVIPDYCLGDVLALLGERLRHNRSLDGHSFLAWAGGLPPRLAGLDKPAARFLREGGEYAADLVDRLLDLLAGLGDGNRDIDELVGISGAPVRMVRKAIALAETGELELERSSRSVGRASRSGSVEGPNLLLDVDRSSVYLRLPQWDGFSDDPVRWRVMLDGVPTDAHPGALGSHEEVVIPRPVRRLSADMGRETQVFDLDVVRADFPLMAFDRMGRFLPGSNPLPGDDVWLLYPEDLGSPEADGQPVVPSLRLLGPVGWNGWCLDRVSLKSLPWVGWGDHTRLIHHRGRPQLEIVEPVLGLRTRSGQHLLPKRPWVSLPCLANATDWRVEVRDAMTGEVLADDVRTNGARSSDADIESWIDVFDGWLGAVLGEFDILVRGPLGTRVNWRVAVAEGLEQRTTVYCRTFVAGGLTRVTVDWGSTTDLVVDPPSHDFGAADRTRTLTVGMGARSLVVECEPNHLEVCRVSGGEASEWSSAPLTLPSDGNLDLGVLEVRMAVGQALPPLQLVCQSGLSQSLPPTGGAGARQRFDLARIADTLRAEKVGILQWPIGEYETTTLATFRPNRLCAGAAVDGDELVLREFAGVSGVAAGVYQVLAPWRLPVILPVSAEGRSPLSDDLAIAGPLAVRVRLEDPWAPAPWPRWPEKAYWLHRDGWPEPIDDAEGAAIYYLAGICSVPEEPPSYPYLWVAWERANQLVANGAAGKLRDDIPRCLTGRPGMAIEALLFTEIPREGALVMGMGAGFLMKRLALAESSLGALWRRFPALASTADVATSVLPWDEIVAVCGDLVESVAEGVNGWFPHVGRFDHAAFLNAKTPSELEAMWRAAQVVPAGLMDIDTRAAAGMALFRNRQHSALQSMTRDGRALAHAADAILRDVGHEPLAAWVRSRIPMKTSWAWEVIPQLSAAFAAMARLAARGDERAAQLSTQFIGEWQHLARVSPDIVEIDIVLAEMLARAATDPHHREADPREGAA